MSSVNICIFMGNLTRDPEVKYTTKGTAVADIGIALNRSYSTESGEKREEVTFLNLTAWGKTGEIIGKHLRKGDLGHFECYAKTESWDDKQTGHKKSKTVFVVDKFTFMPNKRRDGDEGEQDRSEDRGRGSAGGYGGGSQRQQPPAQRPPYKAKPTAADPDLDAPEEDDVPF